MALAFRIKPQARHDTAGCQPFRDTPIGCPPGNAPRSPARGSFLAEKHMRAAAARELSSCSPKYTLKHLSGTWVTSKLLKEVRKGLTQGLTHMCIAQFECLLTP